MDPTARSVGQAAPALDGTVFRQVIGNFMSGVVVITTSHEGENHGMTVSAISSLSLEPPMLLICLNAASGTQAAVHRSGKFGVNILAEQQGHIAERFARPGTDKFAGLAVRSGATGVPLLSDALAMLECRVTEVVTGGTHRVFLGEVVHADAREGTPLAYFRGRFGRFEIAQDAAAYRQIRRLVLSREVGPGQSLDLEQLSNQIGLSLSSVYYALTRLVADKLVTRDVDRGHVVAPLDVATSDDAHDAKLAMELGAAELTVGHLDAEQLTEFRRLAQATAPLISGGRFTDVDAYVEANLRFHYERADLEAVKRIVTTHNERAKATQRAGIERAGGQL
jgi:flavin reductase (DIM6/NTAB) family NADH-FMN oxidoreductase RutF/DNA-binding GntR family transcriptional regulator